MGASSCEVCVVSVKLGGCRVVGWEFSRDLIEDVDDGEFDPGGELGEMPCGVPRGV